MSKRYKRITRSLIEAFLGNGGTPFSDLSQDERVNHPQVDQMIVAGLVGYEGGDLVVTDKGMFVINQTRSSREQWLRCSRLETKLEDEVSLYLRCTMSPHRFDAMDMVEGRDEHCIPNVVITENHVVVVLYDEKTRFSFTVYEHEDGRVVTSIEGVPIDFDAHYSRFTAMTLLASAFADLIRERERWETELDVISSVHLPQQPSEPGHCDRCGNPVDETTNGMCAGCILDIVEGRED